MAGFTVVEHTLPGQHIREYFHATISGQDEELLLHVKQYIPNDNQPRDRHREGVTLIAAHSNAYSKETYEPLWEDLTARLQKAGVVVNAIWMADVAHQGTSGLLNEQKLGSDPHWFDHSRDLLHLVNHFRKQITRPILGIGHSMGAAQMVHLSTLHPRLFHSLILLDPVIHTEAFRDGSLAKGATFRKDVWPTKEQAASSVRRSKFYQTWDERVKDRVIQYGFRQRPGTNASTSAEVTMVTNKHQEAFTLARPNFEGVGVRGAATADEKLMHPDIYPEDESKAPFYRSEIRTAFFELSSLRPSVLFVFGEKSPFRREERMKRYVEHTGTGVGGSGGVKTGRVQFSTVEGGHFFPFENIGKTADTLGDWIQAEVERSRCDEKLMAEKWQGKKGPHRQIVDGRWIQEIKTWSGRTPVSKL
ncbi:hypothetical protein BP6252_02472 [Coleophoma cylindrospora]|uniref:AB hydrolase-1 domain-containing protein n=1 Tax=Coleophoma cylindrospora TaxID=1849047 RepID=A0A3D8SEY5_9HELO|nr:hypothetical protein BP6252_02472 [Coleophoma cylindrospora]